MGCYHTAKDRSKAIRLRSIQAIEAVRDNPCYTKNTPAGRQPQDCHPEEVQQNGKFSVIFVF